MARRLTKKINGKTTAFQCITETPGFQGNCLNDDVLEASIYEFVEQEGLVGDETPVNKYESHFFISRQINVENK